MILSRYQFKVFVMVCHVSHYIAFTFFFFFAIFAKHVSVCCSQFYLDRMILKIIKKMFLSFSSFLFANKITGIHTEEEKGKVKSKTLLIYRCVSHRGFFPLSCQFYAVKLNVDGGRRNKRVYIDF